MMVSTVRGAFLTFSVDADIDDKDMTKSRAGVKVNVASLDTREPKRDAHLRSVDFFDVERFPTLSYMVKSIDPVSSGRYHIIGDLTIKGITREVLLYLEIRGPVTDPYGAQRLGLTAEGRVNRHDYDLDWNLAIPGSGLLVGDEVKITLEAELVRARALEEEIPQAGRVEGSNSKVLR